MSRSRTWRLCGGRLVYDPCLDESCCDDDAAQAFVELTLWEEWHSGARPKDGGLSLRIRAVQGAIATLKRQLASLERLRARFLRLQAQREGKP